MVSTRNKMPSPTAIQHMSARDALSMMIEDGEDMMQRLRQLHAPTDGLKSVRNVRSTEAAALIGRSAAWLRDAELTESFRGRIGREEKKSNWRIYSLEDLNALREHAGTRPSCGEAGTQVLAMLNFKGGASKTTTTQLLAHYLAMAGYRVLLVDLDPQGSLTASFEIRNQSGEIQDVFDWEDSLGPVLTGEVEDLSSMIMTTHWPTIDILPAAIDSYDAELIVAANTARENDSPKKEFWLRLDRALRRVNGYDLVLIDSAPALSFGLINAYMAADGIIVPTPARVVDLQAMMKFARVVYSWIDKLEALVPSRNKWLRLLISQFVKNSMTEQTGAQLTRATFGSLVLNSAMHSSEAIKRGVGGSPSPYETSLGITRAMTQSNAKVRDHLNEVFDEILEIVKAHWRAKE